MALIIDNKKLIFIGGKGGVGKTSISATTSLHLSERLAKTGQSGKILLFSTDPAHSISDSFRVKIGNSPTRITDTLDAMEIDAQKMMEEFKGENKGAIQELLTKTASLNEKESEQAMDLTIPGIDEFMSLVKLSDFIDDNTYRTICVDTAPTGHTLKLLSTPTVVNNWLLFFSGLHKRYKGIMKLMGSNVKNIDMFIENLTKNIYRTYVLITDKEKTEFVIVTIPDLMAVEETKRLIISLYSAGVKVNNMVINNVQTNLDCAFCRARRNHQNRYINMINSMYPEINKTYVPLFAEDINGMQYLKAFEKMLFS